MHTQVCVCAMKFDILLIVHKRMHVCAVCRRAAPTSKTVNHEGACKVLEEDNPQSHPSAAVPTRSNPPSTSVPIPANPPSTAVSLLYYRKLLHST